MDIEKCNADVIATVREAERVAHHAGVDIGPEHLVQAILEQDHLPVIQKLKIRPGLSATLRKNAIIYVPTSAADVGLKKNPKNRVVGSAGRWLDRFLEQIRADSKRARMCGYLTVELVVWSILAPPGRWASTTGWVCDFKEEVTVQSQLIEISERAWSLGYEVYYGKHAIRYFRKARIGYTRLKLIEKAAVAELNLGILYRESGRWQEAETAFQAVLSISQDLVLKERIATTYRNLGILYRESGRWQEAETAYQTALSTFQRLGLKEGIAATYGNLGLLYRESGRWQEAETAYQTALSTFQRLGLKEEVATTHGGLGVLYWESGRWQEAETAYQTALCIYQDLGLKEWIAATQGNLGALYEKFGRWQKAEAIYQAALSICQDLGLKKRVADTHGGLGTMYGESGRWQEAEAAYQTALSIYQDLGLKGRIADTHGNLGALYWRSGRWQEAEAAYQTALSIHQDLGLKERIAETHVNLGVLYGQSGEWQEAETALQSGLSTYQDLGLKRGQGRTHEMYGMLEWVRGDHREAGKHYVQAMELFRAQGLHQEVAWVAYRWGQRLYKSSPQAPEAASTIPKDVELLHQVLDLVVPAAIMLDAVRFDFRDASDRIRWGNRAQQALELAIAVAASLDRPALVAELIETRINATTHTPTLIQEEAGTGEAATADRFASFDDLLTHVPTVSAMTPVVHADTDSAWIAAGSARLVAGARLPAGPPPLLNVPTDTTADRRTVALAPWLENYFYRSITRPPGPVDTW